MKNPPAGMDAPVFQFMQALGLSEKPVVAAVNGAAVGIGTTMLMHCDLVYCADNAMFSMPFVSLGVCSEFASSLTIPLAAGYHKAAEKLLLAEPISAEEAAEMSVVQPASCRRARSWITQSGRRSASMRCRRRRCRETSA